MNLLTKKFRDIKKFPHWLFYFPAALLWSWFHLLHRFEVRDPFHVLDDPHRKIGMTWHNRLLFFPPAFPKRLRRHCVAVVSPSRDGQYVTDFIRCFGIGALRGSSNKKGANALLGGIRALEEGKNVIFTPDGPRGPRYTLKLGPIHLASVTRSQIVPIMINASRCWSVHSWDGFQIPKPFAKITLIIGEPMDVPPDLDAEGLEREKLRVETAMRQLTVDPQ